MTHNYHKELTIIIILYEENKELIFRCLDNIKDFKVIIVDNGADLFLKKQIEKNYKIYNYIINKKNLGYAKAANQGINECDTNYILILGADCLIGAKDINVLVESQKKYNDCFITSPTFYDKNLNLNYSGGYLPENGDKISPLKLEGDMCVESIISTAILFTKKDINEIGKFDENFFLYYSDDDLCRRIKEKKKSVIQIFNASGQHTHGNLKVRNYIKKTFLRNYHYTYDELYYFYKINMNHEKFNYLKKKLPNYFIKMILNFLIFRINQCVYYLSKILAFYKFKKKINQKKIKI